MSTIYTFFRDDWSYPMVCKSDEEAMAAAERNPGTVKVVKSEITHVQVWPVKSEAESKDPSA